MGIAAGGRLRQKIYPDLRGVDTWDQQTFGIAYIHLLNSRQYQAVTGSEPPPSPVTPQLYTALGLPWFDLYDEDYGDVPPGERHQQVKSLRERDVERGADPATEERSVPIDPDQIIRLRPTGKADPGLPM
jgi:hypothetical protein